MPTPTFEDLIPLAEKSDWKLEFGYTLLAVVEFEGVDYVVGRNDWIDNDGVSRRQPMGPMTLAAVIHLDFSAKLIAKIHEVEKTATINDDYFFIFGLNALFVLMAEGLVSGRLIERPNDFFDGIIHLDGKILAFSAQEKDRVTPDDDFFFVYGRQYPYKVF